MKTEKQSPWWLNDTVITIKDKEVMIMAKNDGFGKAMFDMFGVGKEEKEGAPVKEPEVKVMKADIPQPVKKEETVSQPVNNVTTQPVKPVQPVTPRYEKTYVAAGTVFEGTIATKGDIDIAGDVKGTIVADGGVLLSSKLLGNVTAKSVTINNCEVTGDIVASGDVLISEKGLVNGNIKANNIACAGKIIGDLNITEAMVLEHNAVINGNIKMGAMQVARGTKIIGNIQMSAEN